MDSQLKNVKTHARLLSKDMWYEWRLTLLATLRDGFFKMAEGMEIDGEMLGQQQSLLDSILPQLIHRMEQLEREESDLQSAAEELANCDQAELNEARQCLIKVNADIEAKKESIAELRRQLQGKELEISEGAKRREACIEDVREAEKIREECRGWSSNEISALEGICRLHIAREYRLTQCRESRQHREDSRLDNHGCVWYHDIDDISERDRTSLRRLFIPVERLYYASSYEFKDRSLVHCGEQRA